MNNLCDEIKKIVKNCGIILLNCNRDDININSKEGNNNIVTNYDLLIQNKLKKELLELLPDAGFIGEEDDIDNDINNEYIFVVDPIDGTTNFARDIKLSSISVALLKNGKPIIGVCYNPYVDELYEAKKDSGAYLNGKQIHVSTKKLKDGIVSCGCAPYYNELREESLKLQNKYATIASDYRRLGSAVIEICNVASGKVELYFEMKLMPWDYAAASLILEEAGGVITTMDGDEIQYLNSSSVMASNGIENYLEEVK